MKKRQLTLLLACVLALSVFSVGCGEKHTTEKWAPDKAVLLSFDSYEEITGAGLRMNHYFGETLINQDKKYIKEGEGSWLIRPQGDYSKEDGYPSFAINCIDKTVTTADFSNFDKLLLDVYNTTDEEITIKWVLTVHNKATLYTDSEDMFSVLAPNTWTTCEYDLNEYVPDYLNLSEVKYITFTIMDKKETREDSVSELYFDNLRGE